MKSSNKKQGPLRLLTSVPSQNYSRLVVRYPYQTDEQYAHAYHFSAKRLASTFSGDTVDDLILLPFLTLYRHAFELQLKNTLRALVGLRIRYVDGRTTELLGAIADEHLKNKLRHNLHKVLAEVKQHFEALGLREEFPKPVEDLINKLHEADKQSTAFRYAGLLPETQEHADFFDLAEMLDKGYEMLSVVVDYAEGEYEAAPTLDDMEAEMW